MDKITIAINGFGRIGRSVLRALYESEHHQTMQVVAINDLASNESMAHLLQYDSSHGRFKYKVSLKNDQLLIHHGQKDHHDPNAQDSIALLHCADLTNLKWPDVDIVLDCTGIYSSYDQGLMHINAGAKQVLFSHPADNSVDRTIIYGVNHQQLTAQDLVVSNGSCTTNSIIPVIEVLEEAFGIESGTITTIHSAMNDQQVIDAHHSDLRRTRAASQSIIPVDTKLHLGIGRIYPHFANKFEAISVRVPTINVTAMDLSVTVKSSVCIETINQAIIDASYSRLKGILDYTQAPLVSVDFNHDPHSAIVDGTQTRVSDHKLVKLLIWCDNEWGFANRMLDTANAMAIASKVESID